MQSVIISPSGVYFFEVFAGAAFATVFLVAAAGAGFVMDVFTAATGVDLAAGFALLTSDFFSALLATTAGATVFSGSLTVFKCLVIFLASFFASFSISISTSPNSVVMVFNVLIRRC